MLAFGLTLLAILVTSSLAGYIKPENSLRGPYEADSDNLQHWDLTGSAQLGGTFIRLTTDEEEKQGAIWNNFPSFSNNWEIQMHFHIHGKGVYLNGDGMAIWYVKESDMLHRGPVFGSKDYFSGLGVFIDTFGNQEEPHKHRHPYISAMVNNGSLHYEHDEDGTHTQIGGCHVPIRNLEVPTRIAVSYINNNLAVYIDSHGTGQWNLCFKSEGVLLPTGYFIGVSASTSDVSDNHDVIGITYLSFDAEDQPWIDNSDVVPEAKHIQVPYKYHRDAIAEEELQKIVEKREAKDEANDVEGEAKTESESEEETEPPASFMRKLIYITGAILIILVFISVYRKYSERRRERMDKRLY